MRNRKGISSLFIAIYVSMLATILITTLFVGVNLGKSSLTTYMKLEQERLQEGILIGGPGGMQIEGGNVKCLRVNNTGSIAVRIRALYIGQTYKCDPSTFDGDSYIEPKESLWIQLTDIGINYAETKKSIWTVTTERGVISSEKGQYILEGPGSDPDTSNIRIGPFEISFESFHYSKDNGASWQPGWSIPSGTKNVMFKIEIRNIDDEPIILTESSCFELHANDDIPNNRLFWYIQPPSSGYLTIWPETPPVPVIYDRQAPGSKTIPNFNFQPGYTAVNYLIFTGYYGNAIGEPDHLKPIAQTIPFEAVLATQK